MELVSSDEIRGLTVKFTGKEFAAIMRIVYAARRHFNSLDHNELNLTREQVLQIEEDIFGMSAQARSIEKKNGK